MLIAKNDPRLAHGAARDLLSRGDAEQARASRVERSRSGPQNPLKAYCRAWGEDLLVRHIEKPSGDRAKWVLGGIEYHDDSVRVVMVVPQRGKRPISAVIATISRHALARGMQRSLGCDDKTLIRDWLRPFVEVLVMSPQLRPLVVVQAVAPELNLITRRGALLGHKEAGKPVRFDTWIDASQFTADQRSVADLTDERRRVAIDAFVGAGVETV
jgi:hypothetical protein